MPLNFQFRSGSGSATQIYSNEWEWECHSKNKGVLNLLLMTINKAPLLKVFWTKKYPLQKEVFLKYFACTKKPLLALLVVYILYLIGA